MEEGLLRSLFLNLGHVSFCEWFFGEKDPAKQKIYQALVNVFITAVRQQYRKTIEPARVDGRWPCPEGESAARGR